VYEESAEDREMAEGEKVEKEKLIVEENRNSKLREMFMAMRLW